MTFFQLIEKATTPEVEPKTSGLNFPSSFYSATWIEKQTIQSTHANVYGNSMWPVMLTDQRNMSQVKLYPLNYKFENTHYYF